MVEVKSLVMAIISFFIQGEVPLVSTDTVFFVDVESKTITIEQHNLSTIKGQEEAATVGLKLAMEQTSLDDSLQGLTLISKKIYEKDNTLNATIKLSYNSIKYITSLGFHLNTDGTYAYYKNNTIELLTDNGVEEEHQYNFKADQNIKFKITPIIYKDVKLISLAPAWNKKQY
ncbi:hypothetical protein JM80_3306 [Cellulophaga sp. RHA_52]|uniref:hypothetical protein n=2 Tax=Flavobacteriaceae TaxID=49546 RepID=UPI0009503A99|nr:MULTISPECIES: hypothetical protein [Cellulophaga]APU10790.1 hypothetical protein A5M85_11015 [Cellulophaga lytica]TVZ10753.1 hypothetical protein JM80_3306 [Cellulophaga sp. RHA_52]